MNDILVCNDIGAAGNLLRNILLAHKQTHWPLQSDRLKTILKIYDQKNLEKWLLTENSLRWFEKYYRVDVSQDLHIENFKKRKVCNKPVVYLNHSFVWQFNQLEEFILNSNCVIIVPFTEHGFRWQFRAYCEKKGVENMHNFSFDVNVEHNKLMYLKAHGLEKWIDLNLTNMYQILNNRRLQIFEYVSDTNLIPLEWFLKGDNFNLIQEKIKQVCGIGLDQDIFYKVLNAWKNCHWQYTDTENWKYFYVQ